MGAGQAFNCDQTFYLQRSEAVASDGSLINRAALSQVDYKLTCLPQSVTVEVKRPLVQDEVIIVWLNSSVTDPALTKYENSLLVTADGLSSSATHTIKRYGAGGEGVVAR